MREIFRGPSLIFHLVKIAKEKYSNKQVGKTVIQKLMYLYAVRSLEDFDYTMHHYGPYSSKVGEYINMAEALELVEVKWIPEKGYFIEPNKKGMDKLPVQIEEEKLRQLETVIDEFGGFTANELSIISTTIYVKNNFGISDPQKIIETVLSLKPNNQMEWIKQLLERAGIFNEPN